MLGISCGDRFVFLVSQETVLSWTPSCAEGWRNVSATAQRTTSWRACRYARVCHILKVSQNHLKTIFCHSFVPICETAALCFFFFAPVSLLWCMSFFARSHFCVFILEWRCAIEVCLNLLMMWNGLEVSCSPFFFSFSFKLSWPKWKWNPDVLRHACHEGTWWLCQVLAPCSYCHVCLWHISVAIPQPKPFGRIMTTACVHVCLCVWSSLATRADAQAEWKGSHFSEAWVYKVYSCGCWQMWLRAVSFFPPQCLLF